MPALDSNVTDFLARVKADLSVGPDLNGTDGTPGTIHGGPINFCHTQDIANALRLLRDGLTDAGDFLNAEISAIMGGKAPESEQYIGQLGGNEYLIIDAFKKLLDYAGGEFPFVSVFSGVTAAGSTATEVALNLRGGKVRIDEFRGLVIVCDGDRRVVIKNTAEGVVTVDKALPSAPSAGETTVVGLSQDFLGNTARPKYAAGGQPGDNYRLAELIQLTEDAVVAYEIEEEEEEE